MTLRKISKVNLASIALGLAGTVAAMGVSPWFFIATAMGLYLPPLLRIFGILKDCDEFERESIMTGTLVSYAATGVFLFIYLISAQLGKEEPDDREGLLYFLIILQAFSYGITRYWRYWLSPRTGRIILGIELLFWGSFTLLSSEGIITFLIKGAALILPPTAVILLSLKKPRIAGVICLGLAVFFMFMFGVADNFFVFMLLDVPVLLAGISLITLPGEMISTPSTTTLIP